MGSVLPMLGGLAGVGGDALGKGPAGDVLAALGGEFQSMLRANELGAGRLGALPGAGSGLGVSLDAGLDLDLSDEQMRRVAEAADRAQAAGAASALVLIDGRALRLDVQNRRIMGEASLLHGDVLTGIDAVVQASDPAQSALGGLLQAGGSALGIHPDVLRAIVQ